MASKSRIAKLNFTWGAKIGRRNSFVGATVIADYAENGYRTLVLEKPEIKPKVDIGKEYNQMKAEDEAYENELREKE
jgi:hypothetical protein